MFTIVRKTDYLAQVDDWRERDPSVQWEKYFDLLNLNLSEKQVLDCGCGCGHFVNYFTNRQAKVTGFDREQKCLEEAAKIKPGYEKLVQGNIEDIALITDTFDIILVRYVLHHIRKNNRQYVLDSLFKRINPGGKIIIETAFEEQFIKHHDHKIFPRLTNELCSVYPKMEDVFSYLLSSGFVNISEREMLLEWDSYKSIDDALLKSKKLVDFGKGPTAWLLLTKEERVLFHSERERILKVMYPDNIVPRYWYSSVILADKSYV